VSIRFFWDALIGHHYFVSYSRNDGADFALSLADKLQAGPPPYRVWVDTREMQPGRQDWDDQLVEAIQTCRGLLFVMSPDSVRIGSGCKDEWVWALKYKKPVIPVRLHADADLPFRLSSRQFVDFSQGFDTGLAQLRSYLSWASTPSGVLQELRNRLADAERELPRADPAQHPRIEQEIEQLRPRIDEQSRQVEDPQSAHEGTEARIATGLERQREPERPVTAAPRAKFVNPPPLTAPGYFQDRHVETGLIGEFLRADGLRVMSVVGRGGVGKTAMVCRRLKGLERGRLPDDLGELPVDGIVYLSPVGAHAVNFPNLFADLSRLLPEDAAEPLLGRYRDPHETPAALMLALLEAFPAGRTVVLLDNFEDLVDRASFAVTDEALDEALRTLLSAPEHAVKVILTSRVAPRSLLLVQPAVQRRLDLDAGLDSPYAEEILRAMDPAGSLGLRDAPDPLLNQARERTGGFPRALEALAAILAADRDTTLPELLADAEQMPENVVEALVGEAFNRLDPLAQQVMQALAIFTVPVPAVAVDYLLQPFELAIDSAPVLSRLINMQFARHDVGHYYLHPVDRDYALHRIELGQPGDRDADPPPFTQYALRDRGADYFEQTRSPRATWRSLDDLGPQLAEFELRHQAADYDTAAQVLLDIDFDYLILWGHYRLTVDLHQRLQGHLTDPSTNSSSKGNLGNCYAELGETRRAIELYEQALAIAREIGDRRSEATWVGNLGNCYAELGETRRAIELYKQALAIAREIGDRSGESNQVGNLGTRYAELGETRRAIELYEQALAIAREIGDRRSESLILNNQGEANADLGAWEQAARASEQGVEIADEIGLAQGSNEGRLSLAKVYLQAGDLDAARESAQVARAHDYAPRRADVALVLGIVLSRQGHADAAKQAFSDALGAADERLGPANLDTKALALCGLALVDDPGQLSEASTAFGAARAITRADGVVRGVLRLFDALATGDEAEVLHQIRRAAEGAAA